MSTYSVQLPDYSIGEGCYKEIPKVTRYYGKKAIVIGGKTAVSKAKEKLITAVKTQMFNCWIFYGMAVTLPMKTVMRWLRILKLPKPI